MVKYHVEKEAVSFEVHGNVIELDGKYDSSLMSVDTVETTYPDYPEYTNSPRIKKAPLDNKVDLERILEKNN